MLIIIVLIADCLSK